MMLKLLKNVVTLSDVSWDVTGDGKVTGGDEVDWW